VVSTNSENVTAPAVLFVTWMWVIWYFNAAFGVKMLATAAGKYAGAAISFGVPAIYSS
jgi:hypothetical protein